MDRAVNDSQTTQTWRRAMMALVDHMASYNPDPSTKAGAVVFNDAGQILVVGYNQPPEGGRTSKQRASLEESAVLEGAERDAIAGAERKGISLEGATICLSYGCSPDAARAIAAAGIKHVFVCEDDVNSEFARRWFLQSEQGRRILDEAGVDFQLIKKTGELWGNDHTALFFIDKAEVLERHDPVEPPQYRPAASLTR